MKVAVIGAGGAGLTTAWLLDENFEVTLYERDERLGGHAHTITVDVDGKPVALDSGFEFFSDTMFPTFCRLLELLNVPLTPFQLTFTMFSLENGDTYLLPPFRSRQNLSEAFAPRKIADLLRFVRILNAFKPIMRSRDTTVTVEQFLDRLHIPEDFRRRFMYPFLRAGWGVSTDEIKTFVAYDTLKYPFMSTPPPFNRLGWKEIDGGTQTYVETLVNSFKSARVKPGAAVTAVERIENRYRVLDSRGEATVFDHIVLASNANQAAAALARIEGSEEMLDHLSRISYFETTIALHGDTRVMPSSRKNWSTVNIRFDRDFSQISVWKPWKSAIPAFKSWVTHDKQLPDPLYATAKYLHPRVDRNYFSAQEKLQQFQGRRNIWLAGMYMFDVDCHESAVLSAVNVARRLAPDSRRLRQLMGSSL